jgi:hypothetical protein
VSEPVATNARAADLDDVIMSIAAVRYSDGTRAVRLDLDQQAFEDKSYVDLSAADARWLAHAVATALEQIATDEHGSATGPDQTGPTAT